MALVRELRLVVAVVVDAPAPFQQLLLGLVFLCCVIVVVGMRERRLFLCFVFVRRLCNTLADIHRCGGARFLFLPPAFDDVSKNRRHGKRDTMPMSGSLSCMQWGL